MIKSLHHSFLQAQKFHHLGVLGLFPSIFTFRNKKIHGKFFAGVTVGGPSAFIYHDLPQLDPSGGCYFKSSNTILVIEFLLKRKAWQKKSSLHPQSTITNVSGNVDCPNKYQVITVNGQEVDESAEFGDYLKRNGNNEVCGERCIAWKSYCR